MKSTVPLLIILICLFTAGGSPALDVPEPKEGLRASTVLALVKTNRDLCDGLAQRTFREWRRLGGTAESRSRVRKYLDGEASSVAQGRAASDIVAALLPGLASEVGAETSSSLSRLHEKARELCDLVIALPEESLTQLEARLGEVREEFAREEEELGRLLVVPERELEAARQPYLKPIQLAGFEAENEYLDLQDSLRKPPPQRTHEDRMVEWHGHYSAAVRPTRQALGQYIAARQENDFRAMAQACRDISKEVLPLLQHEDIFAVPMPRVPASKGWHNEMLTPLRDAYRAIRDMAADCTAGRSRETQEHLVEMQENLTKAASFLAKFSLRP